MVMGRILLVTKYKTVEWISLKILSESPKVLSLGSSLTLLARYRVDRTAGSDVTFPSTFFLRLLVPHCRCLEEDLQENGEILLMS